jgi:hypothetical protein
VGGGGGVSLGSRASLILWSSSRMFSCMSGISAVGF